MQGRDNVAQFLEIAPHWNISDGSRHSLAVSCDVRCCQAPFVHSAYDRKAIQPNLLRALVMDIFNFLLQRKTPIAHVVHEQHLPLHEPVAVVGELRSARRSANLRPYSKGSIGTYPSLARASNATPRRHNAHSVLPLILRGRGAMCAMHHACVKPPCHGEHRVMGSVSNLPLPLLTPTHCFGQTNPLPR